MNTNKADAAGMAIMLVEERGVADAHRFVMNVRMEALDEVVTAEGEQRWEDFGIFKAELEFWRAVDKEIRLLEKK